MSSDRDPFTRFEHEGWERTAGKYEAAWSGLTRLFVPALLDAVGTGRGTRLLDVATGPGYVAAAARARGAEPIGVDFSAEMVRLASERNPQIPFREGDAQALDFPDGDFEAVVMNFGVLHLADPEAAFAEAHRVLRSGGRYGFTVWAEPKTSPGARIVDEALQAHADLEVDLPEGPDLFGYGDEEECRTVLGGLGFDPASLTFQPVTRDWTVPTAAFLFESERGAGVRTAALLAAQTPERLGAIRAQIEESVQEYATEKGFAIPFAANVVAVTAV